MLDCIKGDVLPGEVDELMPVPVVAVRRDTDGPNDVEAGPGAGVDTDGVYEGSRIVVSPSQC